MSDVYSDGSSAKSLSSLPWLRFLHFRLIHYLSCFFHCLSDSFGCANQVMLFKFQQVWQNISTSLPKKKISLWIIKFCLFRKGRYFFFKIKEILDKYMEYTGFWFTQNSVIINWSAYIDSIAIALSNKSLFLCWTILFRQNKYLKYNGIYINISCVFSWILISYRIIQ